MRIFLLCVLAPLVTCLGEADLKNLAQSNNQFSTRLYKELSKSSEPNLIVSPLSAETILALTSLGAKGETATELRQGLNLPSDPQDIKELFRGLQHHMQTGRFSTLTSANKIYIEKGFGISPEFLEVATGDFGSGVENVNFGETEQTASKINEWVEGQTGGKIKDLISADLLNELTRVVLVNALYFKGQWLYQFRADQTKPMAFHKSSTEDVQVDTMQTVGYMKYLVNEELGATFVELPYRGSQVVLNIVMPNQIDGLKSLESKVEQLLAPQNYTKHNIKLFLPKYKVETSFKLVPSLQNLGVKKVFNRDADLSGMSIQEGLYVSHVVQKVFMNVDEKGTEAAAATAVISMARSAAVGRQIYGEVKIDRPFLFFLRLQDVVLFAGRISSL